MKTMMQASLSSSLSLSTSRLTMLMLLTCFGWLLVHTNANKNSRAAEAVIDVSFSSTSPAAGMAKAMLLNRHHHHYRDYHYRTLQDDPEQFCLERAALEEAAAAAESGDDGGVVCECVLNELTLGYDLICKYLSCEKCNDDADLCGIDLQGAEINQLSQFTAGFSGFQFTKGRNDTLLIYENEIASTCTAFINDIACDTCAVIQCDMAAQTGDPSFLFPYIARVATCGSETFSECVQDWNNNDNAVVELRSGTAPSVCSIDAMEQCLDEMQDRQFNSPTTTCTCNQLLSSSSSTNNNIGNVQLLCKDEACQYCTAPPNPTNCVVFSGYGTIFNAAGRSISDFNYYQYIGDNTQEYNNALVEMDGIGTESCVVRVNGELCSSCIPIECDISNNNNGNGNDSFEVITSSQIECGIYGTLDCTLATGVFEPVAITTTSNPGTNNNNNNYNTCIMYDDTLPPIPTDKPSTTPSFAPTAMELSLPSSSPSSQSVPTSSPYPTSTPSVSPSSGPSVLPSMGPSSTPSAVASLAPSQSAIPSDTPTQSPSTLPSDLPSSVPSSEPQSSTPTTTAPISTPTLPPAVPPTPPTSRPTSAAVASSFQLMFSSNSIVAVMFWLVSSSTYYLFLSC